ncbi:MAG: helix-turn-helix transcriptional regulator [Lachnospiraceae bacterium]|nr:helix-turn-helix transcriptional regulator [Lachnospiraceae bacterium]
MNIREYLRNKKIKIIDISRNTDLPYTTVNDIVNGRTDIKNVSIGIAMKFSSALDISLDDFIRLFDAKKIYVDEWQGEISARGKKYYLKYSKDDISGEKYLCKANKLNEKFVDTVAQWALTEIAEKKRLDEWEWTTT